MNDSTQKKEPPIHCNECPLVFKCRYDNGTKACKRKYERFLKQQAKDKKEIK